MIYLKIFFGKGRYKATKIEQIKSIFYLLFKKKKAGPIVKSDNQKQFLTMFNLSCLSYSNSTGCRTKLNNLFAL